MFAVLFFKMCRVLICSKVCKKFPSIATMFCSQGADRYVRVVASIKTGEFATSSESVRKVAYLLLQDQIYCGFKIIYFRISLIQIKL